MQLHFKLKFTIKGFIIAGLFLMTSLKFSAGTGPDLGFRTRRSTDSMHPAFSPFPFYIFTFFVISFYLFIFGCPKSRTLWHSFPTPVHPTFLECSRAAFKTHYIAFEWKQNICRACQTFLHCKQCKNPGVHKQPMQTCISSLCGFIPSASAGFCWSVHMQKCITEVRSLMQVIFKKILVFKVPC